MRRSPLGGRCFFVWAEFNLRGSTAASRGAPARSVGYQAPRLTEPRRGEGHPALATNHNEVRTSPTRLAAVWYPVMSEVRRLPEFKKLVAELNLVEYWRAYGWADACRPVGDNDFTCM